MSLSTCCNRGIFSENVLALTRAVYKGGGSVLGSWLTDLHQRNLPTPSFARESPQSGPTTPASFCRRSGRNIEPPPCRSAVGAGYCTAGWRPGVSGDGNPATGSCRAEGDRSRSLLRSPVSPWGWRRGQVPLRVGLGSVGERDSTENGFAWSN